MPHALRFYLYLLAAGVVACLGVMVNIAFALIAGYVGVIVGGGRLGVRI
jgi:hypothetical protein